MPRKEISLMLDEEILERIDQERARKQFEDSTGVSRSELINQILALAFKLNHGPDSNADLLRNLTDLTIPEDINHSQAATAFVPAYKTSESIYNEYPREQEYQDDIINFYKPQEHGVTPAIFEPQSTEPKPPELPQHIKDLISEDLAKISRERQESSSPPQGP